MTEAEILGPADRVELLAGVMICKEPQDSPHATAILLAQRVLAAAFGPGWDVRPQMPVALDDEFEPEPDISVVPGDPRDYRQPVPDAAAPFGWRYGTALALGLQDRVAPLAVPFARITVADLLP